MKRNELEELRAEIERLQAAKRRALAIADLRSTQSFGSRWNSSAHNCGSNTDEAPAPTSEA
jgi:hypothetical protein